MTQAEFDLVSGQLRAHARGIQDSKRPGYTGGSVDVLHNFKGVAERLGMTAEQAWCVYFLKHIDAIVSIMSKPELPISEAPLGRFSDAMNYLELGWGLLCERQEFIATPEASGIESGVNPAALPWR